MDRLATLLKGLDLATTRGLEIGPLHNPILRKGEAQVLYVDHVDTAALRRKYAGDPGAPADAIVEVDLVWDGGRLDQATGGERFDYVVASHVIEHVPDLIGWLAQIRSVLHLSGTVRLIVPDRRYCFDYRRETSSVADMILASLAGRQAPGPREILDFMLNAASLDLDEAWRTSSRPEPAPGRAEYEAALAAMRHAAETGDYHDVHCWAFTPLGFARRMRQLAAYGLLGFACTQITETAPQSLDFFVHLMATDDEALIADSWAWAVSHQAAEKQSPSMLRRWLARGLCPSIRFPARSRRGLRPQTPGF